ncbi:hypothetical protein FQZ97_1172590 [compost metagenome]
MSGENDLLQRFKLEVLDQGAEACLPVNLSEEWRETLSQVIERYLDDDDDSQFSLVVGALLGILFGKNPGAEVSVPLDTMFEYMQSYRLELALEEIRRKTEVKVVPATLETIFTDRDLEFMPSV